MEVSLLVRLFEKIAELFKVRQGRKKDVFNEFYRDIFDKLSEIHSNYLIALQVIKDGLRKKNSHTQLRDLIYSERATMKAARDYLEASVSVISEQIKGSNLHEYEVRFIGECDTYLRSYFNGRTSFTGLALLYDEMLEELDNKGFDEEQEYRRRFSHRTFRGHMLDELGRTEVWLEKRFSDICIEYNLMRMTIFKNG
jgi:hypothetical protein